MTLVYCTIKRWDKCHYTPQIFYLWDAAPRSAPGTVFLVKKKGKEKEALLCFSCIILGLSLKSKNERRDWIPGEQLPPLSGLPTSGLSGRRRVNQPPPGLLLSWDGGARQVGVALKSVSTSLFGPPQRWPTTVDSASSSLDSFSGGRGHQWAELTTYV